MGPYIDGASANLGADYLAASAKAAPHFIGPVKKRSNPIG